VARGSIAMSREARRLIRAGAVKKATRGRRRGWPASSPRSRRRRSFALSSAAAVERAGRSDADRRGYDIEAAPRTTAQTGVEMEALTAVAVAALTIYDMVKA